jgi:hypothetical protein
MLKERSMSLVPALRLLLATALAAVCIFGSRTADAQLGTGLTITLAGTYDRSRKPLRRQGQEPYGINFQDCLVDNRLEFQVSMSTLPDSRVEVWVSRGEDCGSEDQREINGNCWNVYSETPNDRVWNISVSPQRVVAGYNNSDVRRTEGVGVEVCESIVSSGGANNLIFHFMVVEGDQVLATTVPWKTKIDVERPPPPTGVTAGSGEDRLIVKWGRSSGQDRSSYHIYCELAGGSDGGVDDAGNGSGGTTSGAGGTSGGGADDAEVDGALTGDAAGGAAGADGGLGDAASLVFFPLQATDGGEGGTSGDGGTGGDDGTSGEGGTDGGEGGAGGGDDVPEVPAINASCPSPGLVQPNPPARYRCGSASAGATQGEATGLQNGLNYAVAVATVDTLGNVGPLSEIECGTPRPVTDFFEAYRDAGGDAGGGFCAIGHSRQSGALVFMLGALVMWIVRRRRAH